METLYFIQDNIPYLMPLLIGMVIRFIVGRRRFNRRGIGGIQHFSSYGAGLIILFIEWIFIWAANLLILYGIVALLLYNIG